MAKASKNIQGQLIPEPLNPGVILTDEQIKQLVLSKNVISDESFELRSLDSCSYDIRIGRKGVIGGQGTELDLAKHPMEVGPGCYAAVISEEKLKIPDNIVVHINSKRSFSYEGIALLTGTQVDPGYEGHLLFAFYNASSRKAVLRRGRAICSITFEALETSVARPKSPDPDLLDGNFPDRFINDIANMEVLSWAQLTEHVKEIDRITTELMELRSKYDDVMKPIRELTGNVEQLTQDVGKLSNAIQTVGKDISSIEKIAGENAKQISALSSNIQMLTAEVSIVKKVSDKHADRIVDLTTKYGRFSVLVYIFWAILLVILGILIREFISSIPMFQSGANP